MEVKGIILSAIGTRIIAKKNKKERENKIMITHDDDLEERINHKIPKYHHTALALGYVSTKNTDGIKLDYIGRFGTGFTIKRHNPSSTRFCFIDYYIYK